MQDTIIEDVAAAPAVTAPGLQDTLHQLAPQDSMDNQSSCSEDHGEQLTKQGSRDTDAAEEDDTSAGVAGGDDADVAGCTATGALLAVTPAAAGASVGQSMAKAGSNRRFSRGNHAVEVAIQWCCQSANLVISTAAWI